MKYLDEYRDEALARKILAEIRRTVTKPWVLMEVCGGQTHSIIKYGIDRLLPEEVELVHGPGCPVCVTSLEMIDDLKAKIADAEQLIGGYQKKIADPLDRIGQHGIADFPLSHE